MKNNDQHFGSTELYKALKDGYIVEFLFDAGFLYSCDNPTVRFPITDVKRIMHVDVSASMIVYRFEIFDIKGYAIVNCVDDD